MECLVYKIVNKQEIRLVKIITPISISQVNLNDLNLHQKVKDV